MRGLSSCLSVMLFASLWLGCQSEPNDLGLQSDSASATEGEAPWVSPIIPEDVSLVHDSEIATWEGLVAYYPLDGDANDKGPSGLDGTNDGASPVPDRFGIADGALSFRNIEEVITFDTALIGDNLGAMGLSMWFKSGMSERGVFYHEGSKPGPGFQFRMIPGKDVLMARSGSAFVMESEGAFNDDAWHHVVVSADGASATMWVDGVVVATHEGAYTQSEAMAYLPALGRDGGSDVNGPKDGFVGALDDLAVFNRPLSEDEVTLLFEDGPPRPPVAVPGNDVSRFGLQIALDGGKSYDPDGEVVDYLWDFGDGSEPRAGVSVSHTYPDYGVYTVTLVVTDNDGAQAYATMIASMRDPECVTPDCDQVDTWDATWSALEMDMLDEVNRNRAAGALCGGEPYPAVPPLEMNEIARVAARLHSLDMGERNYFEHDNPDGLDPFQRMENAGYQGPDPWGENIQAGSSTAADAVASLMTSPGHCRNIMDPDYTVVGLGYAYDAASDYGHYWTQCFGGGH